MEINKNNILKHHCYTKLVYKRINKKFGVNYSKEESEILIKTVLEKTDIEGYIIKGKNFYISNEQHNLKITINSNTFRIITVDRIAK